VTEKNSSSPATERQIVSEHSYGQQLGRTLEKIKAQTTVSRIEQAIADLAAMKNQRCQEYQRLASLARDVLDG
jgi:hypothetical protein